MSYDHFQRCRAVRGHGAERKTLLAELRMEQTMRDHYIIRTVAGTSPVTGKPYTIDPQLIADRKTCEDRIAAIEARLTKITIAPAPQPVPVIPVRLPQYRLADSPRYSDGELIMSRHLA